MCSFIYKVLNGWENKIKNFVVLIHALVIRVVKF